jgi:flagellar motor switch protein FliN/FliY
MARDVNTILKLRVPVIVRLAERRMSVQEVLGWGPGSIIEMTKNADDDLDLMVNNKQIGQGSAVKIGENFGLRVTGVHEPAERIQALSGNEG